jgi:hypothetical protein
LIAKASNGPSHNTSGEDQFTNSSNGIIFLFIGGFLYLTGELESKLRATK